MNVTSVSRLRMATASTSATYDRISLALGPWDVPYDRPPKPTCAAPGCGKPLAPNGSATVCQAHHHNPDHCGCRTCTSWRDFAADAARRGMTVVAHGRYITRGQG